MPESRPMIYILLPVHNREHITGKFVEMLQKQTYTNFKLILVDDGSTDNTVDIVNDLLPAEKLVVLNGSGNLYWGGGLHEGYKYLRKRVFTDGDAVLICNDDTEIPSILIEKLFARLIESNSRKNMVAPLYREVSRTTVELPGSYFDSKEFKFIEAREVNQLNCLATRALMMYAKEFVNLSGFKPFWIPHYLADYEFTHRAYLKGFSISVVKELTLVYNANESSNVKPLKDTFYKRLNRLFSKRSPGYLLSWFYFSRYYKSGCFSFLFPLRLILIALYRAVFPRYENEIAG